MNRPTLTAHSGCDGTADGSMASIAMGIAMGADLVEVDVRRVPVLGLALSHDEAASPIGLVTLRDAFREIARHPSVGINCDLKEHGLAPDVMALAAECGLRQGQLAFSGSLTPAQLADDPSIARIARVYLNIEEALVAALPGGARPWDEARKLLEEGQDHWIEPLAALCAKLRIQALNLPPRPYIQPFLPKLAAAGVRISAWTINEPDDMRLLLRQPWLDNLTTRNISLALSVRAAMESREGDAPWA